MLALLCFCLWPKCVQADPLDQWTWRNPSPTGNDLSGVVYGNNQFVAVGGHGTIVTSPDGTTWTSRTSGTNTALALRGVAYQSNQFVVVGDRRDFDFVRRHNMDASAFGVGTGQGPLRDRLREQHVRGGG